MEAANNIDSKIESQPAPIFKRFNDEVPKLVKERTVSFSKNLENVTIPLDGPDSPSASDVSHTVSKGKTSIYSNYHLKF